MPAAHLVSDLHLDDSRPELTDIFVRFLRGRARTLPKLFLLGDIFEVWVGDDDDSALVKRIASELKAVSEVGTEIYFLHGNRDFLLGAKYAAEAGMTLLNDPTVVSLGGIDTLLTHGDRYCTDDVKYQAFRAQSRNPAWQQAILSRSLEERRAFAKQARAQSAEHQKGQMEEIGDVVQAEVVKDLEAAGVHRMIHGHTHRPADHNLTLTDGSAATRIVLSDWRDAGEAMEIRSDGKHVRHTLT